ncbi:MAG: WhiB family transcriptional regulator [Bifidobacterium longum]|nr:WhiB family transcriptional regulator [Bifidobacterium longum]
MSDWRKSAACAGYDPALWFPGNNQLMRREAIHICHTCPVIEQCRRYAETNNQICGYPLQGIWGGKEFTPRKYRRRAPR